MLSRTGSFSLRQSYFDLVYYVQRLISLVEVAVVAKMEKASDSRDDGIEAAAEVMEDALKIIESCQVSDTLFSCICQG